MTNTKCYTFYSYKGGSGRSTTCINTLLHLIGVTSADPDHPILLVDSDLESAGLTFFFGMEKRFDALSIHTTKLLQNSTTLFDESEKKRIFGKNPGKTCEILPSQIKRIEMLFRNIDDVESLFSGFTIFEKERLILNSIITCAEKVHNGGKRHLIKDTITVKKYNLRWLIDKLREYKDSSPEEKSKIVSDFLPTTQFADISCYFSAPAGTVRFLGVDVNFVGKSVESDGTAAAIKSLIEECSENDYRAVVFDSSAGVQSSADALHDVSDVLVYCMRPSRQFVSGTMTQLNNYVDKLEEVKKSTCSDDSDCEKKPVIILPTAVPRPELTNSNDYSFYAFRNNRFDDIAKNILVTYSEIVDNSFCRPESALNEVEVFKWYEMILGSGYLPNNLSVSKEISEVLKRLSNPESLNAYPDAKSAYETYKRLAEKLKENS